MLNAGILTVSDKGSRGEREDKSGEVIRENLSRMGANIAKYEIVPDEKKIISAKLVEWADGAGLDLILTTGGTGLAKRDVTPEATLAVIDRAAPGFTEAMRAVSLEKTPMAMLSRATSGLRGGCLIINMPGSARAVQECLEVILPAIPHGVEIIRGEVTEHIMPETGKK
jgi:molybdenum cofactor synthesis domain-containing protein